MEEVGSSEMLMKIYQATRRHIPKDSDLHSDRRKTRKSSNLSLG
jgi:hypothetical protein